MQTCSNCGATVREGARFCTACGTQLNDASSGSSPFSWGAAIEQSKAQAGTQATMGWPIAANEESKTVAASDGEPAVTEANSEEEHHSLAEVDEETGIVLSDADQEPISGVVDATEVEDLIPDAGETDADDDHEAEPDLSVMEDEVTMTSIEDDSNESASQDALAKWTSQWSSETEGAAAGASHTDNVADDDDEDVVVKAERLISQLQALVPRLARPKPADPNQKLKPQLLAAELDEYTDGTQWADLREVLERARDNPNDITHLMNVSSNASRLLELLDNREALADRASQVARRLRTPDDEDDEQA